MWRNGYSDVGLKPEFVRTVSREGAALKSLDT